MWNLKWKVKSLSYVWLFATPWTVAYQAPQSMGFSRQEYWSGLPFPSPGDLPKPRIEPGSPTLQADALPSEPTGKLWNLKHDTNLLIYEQEWFADTQKRLVVAKGMGDWRGMGWYFGISQCKLLYIERINNKVLPYSTRNFFNIMW